MNEVELCEIVKKTNMFPGFTLHEEVGMDVNGNSCDMVYHKDDEVYCIEAKLDFNFEVVAQAARWVKKATKSYIAIPYKNGFWRKYGKNPKVDVCDAIGIGIIIVDSSGEIAFCKVGKSNVFKVSDLDRYLARKRRASNAEIQSSVTLRSLANIR